MNKCEKYPSGVHRKLCNIVVGGGGSGEEGAVPVVIMMITVWMEEDQDHELLTRNYT